MHLAFVGDYLEDYNRTAIIRSGLQELGHQVTDYSFKKKSRATKMRLQELSEQVDIFFAPSFTHQQIVFIKKNIGSKKLIFDPLISRYLTKVFDYKLVSKWSFSAIRNYYRDKTPLLAADFVVTDTLEHLKYFNKTFSVPADKMAPLYIGNDFNQFYPGPEPDNKGIFKVGFYGGFIPLQGVMQILETAKILKSEPQIQFELIGNGFEYEKAMQFIQNNTLTNINTPGWLSPNELREKIQSFDLALGIFGHTKKSDLVIPNKIYHYAACKKAILTKDSPAISELFIHNKDIITCKPDPKEMAAQLLELKETPEKNKQLAANAYDKINSCWNSQAVARRLTEYAKDLV